MNLAHWAAAHRRSILFLVAMLALGGVFAALRLPVALFPRIDFPRVVVYLEAGDRSADQTALVVTAPVEQALRAVPGVVGLRSATSRGSAAVSLNFGWGTDMQAATLQVAAAVNQILSALPPGTSFDAQRMDPTVFPFAAFSLTSGKRSRVELRDLATYQLVPLLSGIDGVARVAVLGGAVAEFRVEIDPERMQALGLSFADVAAALASSNVLEATGRQEDDYKLYLMLSDTRLRGVDDIRNTVLRSTGGKLLKLGAFATVRLDTAPQWQRITADGRDAVLVQLHQQRGANTVRIMREVRERLAAYQPKLPAGVQIANWYDQTELVRAAAGSVAESIVAGVILAALVLLVFLRSLKITLVAVLVVPAVLAGTALLLLLFGMSFDIMTLGGMAAAVGLIVDDAIVMIEHIVRRVRERRGVIVTGIREAAIEFTTPLAGSSAATLIIFAPLAFLDGVTGAFFKALSLTMACALGLSFLLAWLAVPLIAEHLVHASDAEREDQSRWFDRLLMWHRRALGMFLDRPLLLALAIVPLLLLGWFAYGRVGSGFIPHMDEGGFVLDYVAAPGTSLSETDRLLRQVEKILRDNPAVDTYSRRTGAQLGGGLTESYEGDFFVRLKPFPRAPIDDVMDAARERIESEVPGLDVEFMLLMEDVIGDLTAVPQPIEIKLYAENPRELRDQAQRIAQLLQGISGVVDVVDGVHLAGDAVEIVVDRDKAALEGIDPQAVSAQLRAWFEGTVATQVQGDVKMQDVRIWVPEALRRYRTQIPDMWLRAADGHRVPLARVARIGIASGQPQISRDNLRRMIAVTARISDRDLGSTMADVKRALAAPGVIPDDMHYEFGGLYKEQQQAFRGLLAVFFAALALVFLLLLFLYEEFAAALAILSAPLLAVAPLFIGLWLTGIELNISAMMGMTMIVGIVTEVSIFYFSELHELLDDGVELHAALIQAGQNRLRPIVMTTLAAALALLPLALALGEGASMQQPLAVAIISGLVAQIPLVVVLMPALYALLKSWTPAIVARPEVDTSRPV